MARRQELEDLKNYGFDAAFAEQIDLCGIGVIRYLGIHNLLWISTTPIMDAVSYNLGLIVKISRKFRENSRNSRNTGTSLVCADDRGERQVGHYDFLAESSQHLHVHRVDCCSSMGKRHVNAGSFTLGGKFLPNKSHDSGFPEIDPNFPNLREIAANASLCFVNADEMFDFPRPIIHKNIYIGGLGVDEPKPLDEKFTGLMNKGKKGVIIISLGTIAPFQAFSVKVKMGFVRVVQSMPDYHFMLKITKDNHHLTTRLFTDDTTTQSFFEGVNNCDFVEWLPQSDILGQYKTFGNKLPVINEKVILKQDLAEDAIRAAIQEILSDER
ncbi:hypothetical protein ANCDUO_03487 [Ancylostoma duodenale]|uniref:glucuronosyltransferase n=1 Tax=Ancylostoma duodenale TaxID=51022 RepID=A0A0C2DTQ3_9BILA|nr:hypothetical protein ANCDUO_03487 [Ancylostoma duodenale]